MKIKIIRYLAIMLIAILLIVQVIVMAYYPFYLLYPPQTYSLQVFLLQTIMQFIVLAIMFLSSYYHKQLPTKKIKFTKNTCIEIAGSLIYAVLGCVLVMNAPYFISYATVYTGIGVYGLFGLRGCFRRPTTTQDALET